MIAGKEFSGWAALRAGSRGERIPDALQPVRECDDVEEVWAFHAVEQALPFRLRGLW